MPTSSRPRTTAAISAAMSAGPWPPVSVSTSTASVAPTARALRSCSTASSVPTVRTVEVDPGVGRQRAAAAGSGAQDQVADAGGQPGLVEQAHEVDRRMGGDLTGLEDEGGSGGQAGGDLPACLQQGVVPRRDQRADADGFLDDAALDALTPGVHALAGRLERPGRVGVEAEDADHVGDVVLALDEALAGVQALRSRDGRRVTLEQVGIRSRSAARSVGGEFGQGRSRTPDGRRRSRGGCPPRWPRRRHRPPGRRPGR